jgi:hypothetical protein
MDEEGDSLIVANEDGSNAAECSNQDREEIHQRDPTDTMDEEGSSLIVANEDGSNAAECSNWDLEESHQRVTLYTVEVEGYSLSIANEAGSHAEFSKEGREKIHQRAPPGTLEGEEMVPLLAPSTLPQSPPQLLHQYPAQDLDILRVGSMTSIKVR